MKIKYKKQRSRSKEKEEDLKKSSAFIRVEKENTRKEAFIIIQIPIHLRYNI